MTPLVLVLIVAGVVCAFVWITSLITKEHSWVDRLWSIVPVVYVWIFAAFAGLARGFLVAPSRRRASAQREGAERRGEQRR